MSAPEFRFERRAVPGVAFEDVELWRLEGRIDRRGWLEFLAEARRHLEELECRGTKKLVLIDPTGCEGLDRELRDLTNRWRSLHLPLLVNVCARAVYVASSPFLRGFLTAMFWFAPPAVPVRVCRSVDEGLEWLVAPERQV